MISLKSLFPDFDGTDQTITGISCDSRNVQPGSLFFAIKGQHHDGGSFVEDAINAGAIGVVAPPQLVVRGALHIHRKNPSQAFALAAAAMMPDQPSSVVAVTGTNGKSSTVDFLRQIWTEMGLNAGSIGTLGAIGAGGITETGLTTPTADALHGALSQFANDGLTHCAMEASSHGLEQFRLDGVQLAAIAFTNFTQDHLDYHTNMDAYRAAKLRLFSDLCPSGRPAILNADDTSFTFFKDAAEKAGLRTFCFGWRGRSLKLEELSPKPDGLAMTLCFEGAKYIVNLPLIGEFQAMNALTAASCALALGADTQAVFQALEKLNPVKGRMELVGQTEKGAHIFVDFAHTPDGLETVLRALRPHTKGRLVCVFGCGGDRDTSKRAPMGAIASRLADKVIVTDDNPRAESPDRIRAHILSGCPGGIEIPDRRAAIQAAIESLGAHDVLIIAGKGHETGQIIGERVEPFSDQDCVTECLSGSDTHTLWTSEAIAKAVGTKASHRFKASSLSIDTRSLEPGALFIALKDQRDGHDFIAQAAKAGASGALVSKDVTGPPIIQVPDVLEALIDLGEAARERSKAKRYAVTGSVGKTSVKEMLAQIFRGFGPAHWPEKSFNNHWGVPLTLARMPQNTQNAVFEIGMSTPGEIAPRSRMVRPDIAIITRIADAHLEGLGSLDAIAKEKAAVSAGLCETGIMILPQDDIYFERLQTLCKQRAPRATIMRFGTSDVADAQFLDTALTTTGQVCRIRLDGAVHEVSINGRGTHWGLNACAALLAAYAGGLDIKRSAQYLADFVPPPGRGTIEYLARPDGPIFTLMDDAYNANPTSMRASLQGFKELPARRRLAVLGEMLEIGEDTLNAHIGLAPDILRADLDELFLLGKNFSKLGDSLQGQITAHKFTDTESLLDTLQKALRGGDCLLVKGSNASGVSRVTTGLRRWGTVQKHVDVKSIFYDPVSEDLGGR